MKTLFSLGFLAITAVAAVAQPFDIVLRLGDPPAVVDRTPKPGPGVNGRFYEPGHPHTTEFRFPLSEFEIVVLDPGIATGTTESVRGLSLVRSRMTTSLGPMGPPMHDQERFRIVLTATNGESLTAWGESGSIPQSFSIGDDSKISYDFTDSAYIGGGGLFGGAGGWDTTVRAYDVKVVSFALVPAAPLVAPALRLEPSGNYFILGWLDRWSTFIAEESGSMWGPWRPLVVQPRSIDDFSKVATPMQEPRYFRLRPRPGPY
jgi:hypothetical protein